MSARTVLRNVRNVIAICALVLASASAHGQASLRGSISASGYTPPSSVQITWRDQSNTRPPQTYTLNKSIPYDGSDLSYAGRYGGGTSWAVLAGLQPAGVGSGEWQGGRSYLILRELYRQKGIGRDPCPGFADKRCQEVIDFAAVEFSRPPGPKEFVAMTGQPDPICGSSCLEGGPGQAPLEAPTDVKLSAAGVLSWVWTGSPVANLNFIVYVREGTVTTVAGLARGQKGVASQTFSVQLNPIPSPTAAVSLWARASKRAPAEIIVRLPGVEPPPPPVDPPPPPPPPPPVDPPIDPPICKLTDVLPSTQLDALWTALSTTQREQLIVRVLETLLKERKELP